MQFSSRVKTWCIVGTLLKAITRCFSVLALGDQEVSITHTKTKHTEVRTGVPSILSARSSMHTLGSQAHSAPDRVCTLGGLWSVLYERRESRPTIFPPVTAADDDVYDQGEEEGARQSHTGELLCREREQQTTGPHCDGCCAHGRRDIWKNKTTH